ncbi:MAG: hypothetical protein OSB00_12140, partial [Sphingomonas bacterium]|nr:hypothetical protein [Sphingomonas bacterium]
MLSTQKFTHCLSTAATQGTSAAMTAPQDIFDRSARRRRRNVAAPNFTPHDFLRATMLDGIA